MPKLDSDLQPQALATATALPARFYTGEGTAAADQSVIFNRHWQYVCHASQIADEGDYVVSVLGQLPVIVIRTADGLRGYHNVCRHRAGPLAQCSGKGAKQLRCRYHGWTYNLDGSLRTATEMKDVADFDVSSVRLPALQVREFAGLVFAASENPPPFEDYVAGIAERLAVSGHALADLRFHQHLSYDIDCNWKTYVDNYLEGYHVPHVHPELNKLLDYRSYVTETKEWYSMQFSPLESGDDLYGSGEALYYFMYPNTMLNILPGRLQTNRVLPLPNNRCRVEFDFFYVVSADPSKDEARRKRDLEFSDVVQDEDIQICVDVQRGLDSGSYTAGRLNPLRENALHHFQELLRSDYRSYSSSVGSNAAG